MKKIPPTIINDKGQRFHIINEVTISCSGTGCRICSAGKEQLFTKWELFIPYPKPPKGKRYKNKTAQKYRGRTIKEICYTCKPIPCYICKRGKCKLWHKDAQLKGQEKGCYRWVEGRCKGFVCKKGIIKSTWKGGKK